MSNGDGPDFGSVVAVIFLVIVVCSLLAIFYLGSS